MVALLLVRPILHCLHLTQSHRFCGYYHYLYLDIHHMSLYLILSFIIALYNLYSRSSLTWTTKLPVTFEHCATSLHLYVPSYYHILSYPIPSYPFLSYLHWYWLICCSLHFHETIFTQSTLRRHTLPPHFHTIIHIRAIFIERDYSCIFTHSSTCPPISLVIIIASQSSSTAAPSVFLFQVFRNFLCYELFPLICPMHTVISN